MIGIVCSLCVIALFHIFKTISTNSNSFSFVVICFIFAPSLNLFVGFFSCRMIRTAIVGFIISLICISYFAIPDIMLNGPYLNGGLYAILPFVTAAVSSLGTLFFFKAHIPIRDKFVIDKTSWKPIIVSICMVFALIGISVNNNKTSHWCYVASVSFSPDSRYIVSGSLDDTIKLWDVETKECLKKFTGHSSDVVSVSISPDGGYIISGSYDNTIRLWDIQAEKCIKIFRGHDDKINSVCFSPDGKFVCSGSDDEAIKLWDVQSGECLRTFTGHTSGVKSVSFSPTGNFIASGTNHKVKLWYANIETCLGTLNNSGGPVSFSPNNKYIACVYYGTLQLWDFNSGQIMSFSGKHNQEITSVNFSSDGKYIVSGSIDDTIKLWNVEARVYWFSVNRTNPFHS